MTGTISSGPAVAVEGLRKRYGRTEALSGVSFAVERGTVLGLLGPNGSGKTTSVRILSTLLRADAGTALVNGVDVMKQPDLARYQFSLAGQSASVDELLSGRDNLILIGRLSGLKPRQSRQRVDALIEAFDLTDAGDRRVETYSGGMRRRIDLAASLVADPPVLFLDEPTTGLDPRSRQAIWTVIAELVKGGTSVLLTTQYLEEADRLADRIVVIEHGSVIANDTPRALKRSMGGEQIQLTVADDQHLSDALEILQRITANQPTIAGDSRQITVAADGGSVLADVIAELARQRIAVEDIGLRPPSLDEVFLQITGRPRHHHDDVPSPAGGAVDTQRSVA